MKWQMKHYNVPLKHILEESSSLRISRVKHGVKIIHSFGKNVVTSKQVYPSAKARVKRTTLNNPDQTIIMPGGEGGEMDQ